MSWLDLQYFSSCSHRLIKTLSLHVTGCDVQEHIDLVLLDCLALELVTPLPINFFQLVFLCYLYWEIILNFEVSPDRISLFEFSASRAVLFVREVAIACLNEEFVGKVLRVKLSLTSNRL